MEERGLGSQCLLSAVDYPCPIGMHRLGFGAVFSSFRFSFSFSRLVLLVKTRCLSFHGSVSEPFLILSFPFLSVFLLFFQRALTAPHRLHQATLPASLGQWKPNLRSTMTNPAIRISVHASMEMYYCYVMLCDDLLCPRPLQGFDRASAYGHHVRPALFPSFFD